MFDDEPPLEFILLEAQLEAGAPPEVILLALLELTLLVPFEDIFTEPDAEALIPLVEALADNPALAFILPDAKFEVLVPVV